jgi:hypothetical protein
MKGEFVFRVHNLLDEQCSIIKIRAIGLKSQGVFEQRRKGIRYIIQTHKKELIIGILVLALFVTVVAAAVYSSMYMQSTIGVEGV